MDLICAAASWVKEFDQLFSSQAFCKVTVVPISDEKIDENEKAELRKDPRLKIILRSHQSLLHPENLPQAIPDFVISRFVTPAAALQCNKRN